VKFGKAGKSDKSEKAAAAEAEVAAATGSAALNGRARQGGGGGGVAQPSGGSRVVQNGSGRSNNGDGRSGSGGAPTPQQSAALAILTQPSALRPAVLARSKPPLPELTEEAAAAAYEMPLPTFREVPPIEKQALMVRKLHLCSFVFDFSNPGSHVREKEMKRQTLLELVDYVNTGTGKFTELVSEDVVFMLSSNLFRSLPPRRGSEADSWDPDEEEPSMELAWPHLQIVYEFLLRYVVCQDTDAKTAKKHVDQVFVVKILELFDSEDPRERDYLKTVLHRIYGKFMMHRPFIRKAINNVFYRFVFETERHNGIAELLEILGSIINGFALPLKEEHKGFLTRALMPLHKPKCIAMYHQQLAYCVTQFVEKEPELADNVIRALLRFWPLINSQKEVLFLSELEEILEITQPAEFQLVLQPLFRQLSRSITNPHFQVAERALFLWNNEAIVSLVAQHRAEVLPAVLPALERNTRSHWNAAVVSLTANVKKMFQEMDGPLYDHCRLQFEHDELELPVQMERRRQEWYDIEHVAEANQRQRQAQSRRGSLDAAHPVLPPLMSDAARGVMAAAAAADMRAAGSGPTATSAVGAGSGVGPALNGGSLVSLGEPPS